MWVKSNYATWRRLHSTTSISQKWRTGFPRISAKSQWMKSRMFNLNQICIKICLITRAEWQHRQQTHFSHFSFEQILLFLHDCYFVQENSWIPIYVCMFMSQMQIHAITNNVNWYFKLCKKCCWTSYLNFKRYVAVFIHVWNFKISFLRIICMLQ